MPEFSTITPYVKQISFYFQQGKYQAAFGLSEECVGKFPNNMVSYFLLAKSAFWLNDFEKSREASLKSFNISLGEDEMAVSGILLACNYYKLRDYEKGLELLRLLKTKLRASENIAKLKFIFALALHNEPAAMRHLNTLYAMNKEEANKLMFKLLGGANL